MLRFIFLILVSVSLGGSAFAQRSKKRTVGDLLKKIEKKAKHVNINKKRSNLPSFTNIKKNRPSVNLRRVKPPVSNQLYYADGTNEAELESIIDQEIKQLFNLTKRFKKSSRRGELWLRLAELYSDKSKIIELKLQRDYDKKIAAHLAGKTKKPRPVNLSVPNSYNKKALQLYEWFLRDYPKDEKVPQALYYLGYNHVELGNFKKGKNYYLRLAKSYPKSIYINEANFSVGEYYFDSEQWKKALPYYQKVTKNRRARLYSFALYKKAWCNYKIGKVVTGLKDLQSVIIEGRKSKSGGDVTKRKVSRIRLANEAVKDLVTFYAEAGDPERAYEYFGKVLGARSAKGKLKGLALRYLDIGKKNSARYVFKTLIDKDPMSPKAFEYQYQIIRMYSAAGEDKIFKSELFEWTETYGEKSDWAEANSSNTKLMTKSQSLLESTLRNYTLQQHQSAQNSKSTSARSKAEQAYNMYFATFDKSKKLDEMHFFYAELLYDMKKFSKAGVQYNWVTENAPKSKYYEKSILNTILALGEKLPKQQGEVKTTGTEPKEFDKPTQLFEKVANRYFNEFPNGEKATAILYRLGSLKYSHNQFDSALVTLNKVVDKDPKSEYAKYSANMILDIYNKRKDYDGLNKAANQLLANSDLASSATGKKLKNIKQRAEFKKLEEIDKAGDPLASAKAYETYAKANNNRLGATALFNAGIKYEKAGELGSAVGIYASVLAAKLATSDEKKSARQFLGVLYEKIGQYPKAAIAYQEYAKIYSKDKKSADFYYNAAVIQDGLRQYRNALRNYQAYYDKTRSREKREILFRIGKIWELRRNYTRAIAYFDKYIKSGTQNKARIMEAVYLIAKLNEKRGRRKSAEEWYKKVYYTYNSFKSKGSNVGASYAAEADFKAIKKNYYDKLRAIKVPRNSQQQSQAIQKKINMLNRLKDKLKRVIDYDDGAYIVAALTLQGQAFHHVANAIYKAPPPSTLKGADLEAYKKGIDGLASPFKTNAIDFYKQAVTKGFDLEAYDSWINIAQKELTKLGEVGYLNQELTTITVKALESKGLSGDFISKDSATVHKAAQTLLEKDPTDLKALNALGYFYANKAEYDMARIIYKRALKDHPDSSFIHNNLGVIYLAENDNPRALAAFKKSQSGEGKVSIGKANAASIYLKYGDFKRAIGPLEDAYDEVKSDLSRDNARAAIISNNYAVALIGAGDAKDAKSIFKKVLDTGYRDVSILFNYAILLVDVLKDKEEAYKVISKIKFTTDNRRLLEKAKQLEGRTK